MNVDELDVEIYESWLEAAGSGGSADEVLFTYAAPANGAGHAHEHSHGCEGLKGFGGLGHGSTGVERKPDCASAALPLAPAMLLRYS